tara:strand:- start:4039 stop:4380 length:342 start_codon:yes stop_codon:yes gene_type:complete
MRQSKIAKFGKTLIWYDGPMTEELFMHGRTGETCCYDWDDSQTSYVAFFPSDVIMARYRARSIDLLSVMTHRDTERFHFTDKDRTSDGSVQLHPIESFTDNQLPEPGFYHADL